jgi:hypothetical protein
VKPTLHGRFLRFGLTSSPFTGEWLAITLMFILWQYQLKRRRFMNFLMTITYKDSFYTLPAEKRAELVKAVVAYHDKYRRTGKLKETLTFSNAKLMSIWNVASFEEMLSVISEHPYSVFVNYSTEPFLDHEEVIKFINKNLPVTKK